MKRLLTLFAAFVCFGCYETSITAPEDGTEFCTSQEITFEGSATNMFGRELEKEDLSWESDIDGLMGSGSPLLVQLSEGEHSVSLKLLDKEGLTLADEINLRVETCMPEVLNIPDQTIWIGEAFGTINLDDYVIDEDTPDENIICDVSGNVDLMVDITDRVVRISYPDPLFANIAEVLTFEASDGVNTDSGTAAYTAIEAPYFGGTWVSDCNRIGYMSNDSWTVVFMSNELNRSYTGHIDWEDSSICEDPLFRITFSSTYTIGNDIINASGETVTEIDYTHHAVKATVLESTSYPTFILMWNGLAVCGFSDWEPGVTRDITGIAACNDSSLIPLIPAAGDTSKEVFQFSDGNLVWGLPGELNRNREEELGELIYSKQ